MKHYQVGYDAAELGRDFASRLAACGVVDNCHLKEFRFMFLSFCHYVHLVQNKLPPQQMEEILNMKIKDVVPRDMDCGDGGALHSVNIKREGGDCSDSNHADFDTKSVFAEIMGHQSTVGDDDDGGHRDTQSKNVVIEGGQQQNDDDDDDRKDTEMRMGSDGHDASNGDRGMKMEKMDDEVLMNMFRDDGDGQKERKQGNERSSPAVKAKSDKASSRRNSGGSQSASKSQRNNHRKQAKGKRSKGKQRRKGKYKRDVRDEGNVQVYSFGADGKPSSDQGMFGDEQQEEQENGVAVEQELNDKMIELCAARAVLFPKYQHFEAWVGSDMKLLSGSGGIWDVVTALKGKFQGTEQTKL